MEDWISLGYLLSSRFVHLRTEETRASSYCAFWESTWRSWYACCGCNNHSSNGAWRWN